MKQFLYLDVDIVNSIIAQSEQGLIQSLSNEQVSSNTESDHSKITGNIRTEFGGSLAKLVKAQADLTGSLESLESDSSTSTSREIISKTMHDAAFDIAYNNVCPIKIEYGDQSADDTGNYIEMTRVFDFVDFDYLERLFKKDGVIDFIKNNAARQMKTEVEKVKEGYHTEQLRKAGINLKDEIEKAVNLYNEQLDSIAITIKALRGLIPYDHMLIANDGYLIPLNTKYFRVDPVDLGFKYGGEITCVGMITNIIGEDTDPENDKNIFANLQFQVNEVLRSLLPIDQNNLCVIHPIAIYYGN